MAKALNANELLAKAIIKAMNIREESWNNDAKAYGLSIEEACNRATSNKDRAAIVSILLFAAWNDAIQWALDIEEKI